MLRIRTALGNLLLLLSALVSTASAAPDACPANVQVMAGNAYRVSADGTIAKSIAPSFFGFNIEAPSFQLTLFDSATGQVLPQIIAYMQAFPGAVYRYPGGTVANFSNWEHGIGPLATRPYRAVVTWHAPMQDTFGFPEYLNFVAQVKGQAWLVPNLYGNLQGEKPTAKLAASARAWAALAKQDQAKGMPGILRWELGNELYEGPTKWTPQQYNKRALAVAAAIRSADDQARLVVPLEEYTAQPGGMRYEDYNTSLAQALASYAPDYSQHFYVDGSTEVSLVPSTYNNLCQNIGAIAAIGQAGAGYWITEFARAPLSWDNLNKSSWGRLSNMGSALSIADMLIGLSQIPQVKGAFLLGLATTIGPWPLFYKNSAGVYRPTLPYWTLRILRESLLSEVLTTYTQSANRSNYAGGYDLRASVLTDATHQHYAVWAVNRAGQAIDVQLHIPALADRTLQANLTTLSSLSRDAADDAAGESVLPAQTNFSMTFDSSGNGALKLPGYAVAVLRLGP